jgi:hypothetical protein
MYNSFNSFVKVQNIDDIVEDDIIKAKPDAYGYSSFKSIYGTDYGKIMSINKNNYKIEDSVISIVGCDENGVIPNPANPAYGRLLFKNIDIKIEKLPMAAAAAGGSIKKSKSRKNNRSKYNKSKSRKYNKSRSRSKGRK